MPEADTARFASVMPCKRCGAPMAEASEVHLAMRCTFCGHAEGLPTDAAARAQALQLRIKEIGWMRESREAAAIALVKQAKGFERTLRAGLMLIALALGMFAIPAFVSAFAVGLGRAVFAFAIPSIFVAIFVGYFVFTSKALHDCADELRPLLEALPARIGASLECRVCGGPMTLASNEGAFVVCAYCGASNLIGPSDATHHARLLAGQLEAWRAASQGEQPRVRIALETYRARLNLATVMLVAALTTLIFAMLGLPSLLLS